MKSLSQLKSFKQLSCLLCLSILALIQAPAESLADGTAAYEAKDYTSAITAFTSALETEGESAALRHNLALSYAQSGQLSEALWQLERAQRLDPFNSAWIQKIELLKSQMGLLSSPPAWYALAARALSFQNWVLLTTAALWIAFFIFWLCPIYAPSKAGLRKAGSSFSLVVGLVSLALSVLSYLDTTSGRVISEKSETLRAAPAKAAPAVAELRPGTSGRIVDQHEGYYQIKTMDSFKGWIAKDSFRPLTEVR